MWDWPTLSPWDIRFAVWICTYGFRAHKMKTLAQRPDKTGVSSYSDLHSKFGGLDSQTFTIPKTEDNDNRTSLDIVSEMLDGYFDRLRRAVWLALGIRLGVGTLAIASLIYRYRWAGLLRL